MNIRPATPVDLVDLVALEHEAFATDAWSESLVRAEVEGERVALVAVDPHLVGWASFSLGPETSELLRIATTTTRRRGGVARALLNAGLSALRERGIDRLMLEVAESNTPAREFYDSAGFVEIHRRRGYYGRRPDGRSDDALVLSCEVGVNEVDAHG